jgi:hypothetical protein
VKLRFALVFGSFLALTQLASAQPKRAMVDDEIRMLEFIEGGAPLTATERQEAAGVVAAAMRTAPARWSEADSKMRALLVKIGQGNEPFNNALREKVRYIYALTSPAESGWPEEFVAERRIIDAHDPVLAIDAARGWVFTRQMEPYLQRTATWAAKAYGLPPPGPDFMATIERADLTNFAATDPVVTTALAHIERNAWFAPAYFDHVPRQMRETFFARSKRTTFHNLENRANEQRQIGEAGAVMAAFAAKHGPSPLSGAAEGLMMRQMEERAMTGAMRSMSPACNTSISISTRAGNGCFPQ